MEGSNASGIRDRDDGVDVMVGPRLKDALGETLALVEAGLIDRNAVDDGVRPGELDVLENARREGLRLGTDFAEKMP